MSVSVSVSEWTLSEVSRAILDRPEDQSDDANNFLAESCSEDANSFLVESWSALTVEFPKFVGRAAAFDKDFRMQPGSHE